MKFNWVPLFILFYLRAVYSQLQLEGRCPVAEDIKPCKCGGGSSYRRISCQNVNDLDTLRSVFQNAEGYLYHEIYIHSSTLQYIPREILEKTPANTLNLDRITLTQISDAPPQGVQSITDVYLQNLKISGGISWNIFQEFINLKELWVVDTPVGVLGPSFSQYMSKKLDLVWFLNSEIKEIKPGALSQLSNLKYVDIDNCSLSSFTRDILPRPWIKGTSLYLKNNKISSIPDDLFKDIPNLDHIYLSNNLISELPESAFQGNSVRLLNLSDNPLRCDCQMRWLLKRELVLDYSGVCASPKRLEGKKLEDLTTSDFQCIGNTLTDLN